MVKVKFLSEKKIDKKNDFDNIDFFGIGRLNIWIFGGIKNFDCLKVDLLMIVLVLENMGLIVSNFFIFWFYIFYNF